MFSAWSVGGRLHLASRYLFSRLDVVQPLLGPMQARVRQQLILGVNSIIGTTNWCPQWGTLDHSPKLYVRGSLLRGGKEKMREKWREGKDVPDWGVWIWLWRRRGKGRGAWREAVVKATRHQAFFYTLSTVYAIYFTLRITSVHYTVKAAIIKMC